MLRCVPSYSRDPSGDVSQGGCVPENSLLPLKKEHLLFALTWYISQHPVQPVPGSTHKGQPCGHLYLIAAVCTVVHLSHPQLQHNILWDEYQALMINMFIQFQWSCGYICPYTRHPCCLWFFFIALFFTWTPRRNQ